MVVSVRFIGNRIENGIGVVMIGVFVRIFIVIILLRVSMMVILVMMFCLELFGLMKDFIKVNKLGIMMIVIKSSV